jgi:hypothetical protein
MASPQTVLPCRRMHDAAARLFHSRTNLAERGAAKI